MMQLAWGINWELIPAYGNPSVAFSEPTTSTWYNSNQQVDWTVFDADSSGLPAPGQSVTLTATISHGTAMPTGTVTFKAGTTVLATVAVGSAGTATYTSSAFTVATHAITAVYSGDSNYAGSTSAAFSQVVNQAATTTSLASPVNPSTFGQSVTLTATVAAVAPGTGTPAGSVQFYDGTTLLGSHGLTGGVATLVTTKLATGTNTIIAVYVASADYLTSTSSALSQVVDKANTKTTLASSPNPSTSGATVTFTATVSAVCTGQRDADRNGHVHGRRHGTGHRDAQQQQEGDLCYRVADAGNTLDHRGVRRRWELQRRHVGHAVAEGEPVNKYTHAG